MAVFPVADEDTRILLMQGAKASAFAQGGVRFDSAPRSATSFATYVGDIDFVEHDFGDDEDKAETDTATTKVPVRMTTLSHNEYFDRHDFTPESAAAELVRRIPEYLPGAIDKYLARETAPAGAAWGGWTGTPAELSDGQSFLDAQDALSAAGFEPTLSVWSNQAKPLIRKILNEDTSRAIVAVPLVDGISLGDTTAYFRPLYTGALAAGKRIGQILDPRFTRVFLGGTQEITVVTPDTDSNLARKNAIFVQYEVRIGVGSVQDSVIPVVADLGA